MAQGRAPASITSAEGYSPLQTPADLPMPKVLLGRELFHDRALSKGSEVACASCHDISRGGADGRRFSVGVKGALGVANAPSVFNSVLNFKQFWDGRADTLADQIEGPIANPVEMGTSWPEIVEKLGKIESYKIQFGQIYPDGITHENIVDAIVAYEKSLITTGSAFDRYLRGEKAALSKTQLTGYQKFQSYGCVSCHQGANFGGNMFQAFGVMRNYFADRGGSFPSDLGRYNVTKLEADRHVFRVPSLRNVALTAPYFHDGSTETLEEAVQVMAKYQLGRKIPKEDVAALVEFLRSLTGELPPHALPPERGADAGK